jgi:hypothetical protein
MIKTKTFWFLLLFNLNWCFFSYCQELWKFLTDKFIDLVTFELGVQISLCFSLHLSICLHSRLSYYACFDLFHLCIVILLLLSPLPLPTSFVVPCLCFYSPFFFVAFFRSFFYLSLSFFHSFFELPLFKLSFLLFSLFLSLNFLCSLNFYLSFSNPFSSFCL